VRLVLCLFLAAFAAIVRGETGNSVVSEFPFQFREGLLWVEVNIPQSNEPLNFLVDSGAGVSVINLETAERIGLKLGRKVHVQSVRTNLTGFWQEQITARIEEIRLPREYLAVDLSRLSSSCERPVDGLIGADFFRNRVVQIDFESQVIRLLKPTKGKRSDSSIPLQIRECGMRIPISVNGHKRQWVRLDTGCATALQWVTSDIPEGCAQKMALGLAELSIPQAATTVAFGEHEFESVPTGLHETAIFPGESGLLGNGLLSQFSTVTIDARRGQVTLGKLRSTP